VPERVRLAVMEIEIAQIDLGIGGHGLLARRGEADQRG
jgi:hypothetical protein